MHCSWSVRRYIQNRATNYAWTCVFIYSSHPISALNTFYTELQTHGYVIILWFDSYSKCLIFCIFVRDFLYFQDCNAIVFHVVAYVTLFVFLIDSKHKYAFDLYPHSSPESVLELKTTSYALTASLMRLCRSCLCIDHWSLSLFFFRDVC